MSSEESGESLHNEDPNELAAEIADAIDAILFDARLECKHEAWTEEMLETLRAFIHDNYDDLGSAEDDDEEYDPAKPVESSTSSSESPKAKKRTRK